MPASSDAGVRERLGDGYLRVSAGRDPKGHLDLQGQQGPTRHSPLAIRGTLFVDLEPTPEPWQERLQAGLRYAGESAMSGVETLLVRAYGNADPPLAPELLADTATYIDERWGVQPLLGAVRQHVAPGAFEWAWLGGQPDDLPGLLARCRSAEITALIDAGRAHWIPKGYHYKLPSGEHRPTFVRLGDAIRSRRDAHALAWWLLPHFREDGCALLLDSSSLLPLALALENELASVGRSLGNVATQDSYPEMRLEDALLVDHVGGNGIVCVLSVSSTGGRMRSLEGVLPAKRAAGPWVIENVVAFHEPAAESWALYETASHERQAPWVKIRVPIDREVDASEPYLEIDPQTFANTTIPVPPSRVVVHPPGRDQDLGSLLTMYDQVDGIGIECDFDESTRRRRGTDRTAIRFFPERLLRHPNFLGQVDLRLREATGSWYDGRDADALGALTGSDLIVYDVRDGSHNEIVDLAACIGVATSSGAIPHASIGDEKLIELLGEARKVMLVTLGLVTGASLERLEMALLEQRRQHGFDFEMCALAVHARPASLSEWQAARSSMNGRLVALWITYLPWMDPLQQERQILSQLPASQPGVERYVADRMKFISSDLGEWEARVSDHQPGHGVPNPRALFWLPHLDLVDEALPRLLPGSRFGEQVSMLATYVGVAAAMHRTRIEQEAQMRPPWIRFDLTKMNKTYFETPIGAALLRWIRPHEALWQSESGKGVNYLIREFWDHAQSEHWDGRATILGELLLAANQGKVPHEGFAELRRLATELRDETGELPGPVATGLALLDHNDPQ